MKLQRSHRVARFAFNITAVTLAASLRPGLAAPPPADHPAAAAAPHSHGAMQQVPRLQPKRVVTVTGNEDRESQRGFGKDAAMAEMMTLMMVGGSGMEHMRMGPMKKGSMSLAGRNIGGMNVGDMAMSGASNPSQGLPITFTVTPNPPVVGDNALDIAVTDASGKPVTGLKLAASVAMTSMDMGTTKPKVTEGQAGHYTAVVNFSMKGPWRVMLTGGAPENEAAGAVRTALDFNVGSTQKSSQLAGPTTTPISPHTPATGGPTESRAATVPPGTRTAGGPAGSKRNQAAGPRVTLNTPADTLKVGKNTLQFTILDAAGQPVTGAKITTAVAMTSMDMGTAHPRAREGKDGHYTTGVEFSMKGPWRVTLTVTSPKQKPFTHAFDLDITK